MYSKAQKFAIFSRIISTEGGFQKDYQDHGNWTGGRVGKGSLVGTKYGISAMAAPNLNIPNITYEQALSWYIEHYWQNWWNEITDMEILHRIADIAVNAGHPRAATLFQIAIAVDQKIENPDFVDGIVGPNTMRQYRRTVANREFLEKLMVGQACYYYGLKEAQPKYKRYIKGWMARALDRIVFDKASV